MNLSLIIILVTKAIMQKIHRRKNQQIAKQFICPQHCGKAYGSYAALYTHVKNKHSNSKLPQMKAGHLKPKQNQYHIKGQKQSQQAVLSIVYDCKICKNIDCTCKQLINYDELQRAIGLMTDQAYIKFINYLGNLHYSERQRWIRNTEQTFQFYTREKIRDISYEFNMKFASVRETALNLSNKWFEYLSYTSRILDKKFIQELYFAIFLILTKENVKEIENNLTTMNEFENVKRSMQMRPRQWTEFIQFIKAVV